MDSQWLTLQFQLHPEKTKTDLARALGLTAPAISKILHGTRQIKAQEYHGMRRFFGLPTDGEKALHAQRDTAYVLEPLREARALKEPEHTTGHWMIPADIMGQRTQTPPDKIKVFKVEDTMMEPAFKRGEHVLVDISDTRPSPPGPFVLSDGFGYIVRHCAFVARSTPPIIELSTTNPQSALPPERHPAKHVNLTGRVIAKLQWL